MLGNPIGKRTGFEVMVGAKLFLSVKGHEYSPPGVNSIPHLFSELSDSI